MTTTTRKTRKAPWTVVLTALLAVLGLVFGVMTVATPAVATPDPTQVCAPLDSGKIDTTGDPGTVTITAPAGTLITGYCVKAGSANQGDGPVYVPVDPPVASLEISYPGGKAISNYSYSLGTLPTYYYAGKGSAEETACTLVEEQWMLVDFGPFAVTGPTVPKSTVWTDTDKAVEDAKAQAEAEQQLATEMGKYTIDVTGDNCTPPPPPPTPGSQQFCVAPVGTTTFAYDTFGTTDNTRPQSTWTNGSGLPLSAYVTGTAADCTPPPPPPPTEPEPVAVVEPATVAAVQPATVPVPAHVTLPARIPAGEGPTVPTYVLALLVLGATALAVSTVHLVRTTR